MTDRFTRARDYRATITIAALRHDPALKFAVKADCEALAKAGAQERGYADIADLTRAGYTEEFALHQAEVIAHAGRKASAMRGDPASAERSEKLKGGADNGAPASGLASLGGANKPMPQVRS